jgi:membrane associated rhomboid family serine protease
MRPITERLSPVIRALVVTEALLFLFYVLVKPAQYFFNEHLALNPLFYRGEIWQPLSSMFVHVDFISFAFNIIGLWFVGATVERTLGTRRFLMVFFASGVVAAVVTLLLFRVTGEMRLIVGCGSAVLALFVAFGVAFGRTPTRVLGGLVLEARTLTAILVGFALVADVVNGSLAQLGGDVAALLLGYALAGGRGQELKRLFGGMRAKRARRRYQVLEGGRGTSASGHPPYLN